MKIAIIGTGGIGDVLMALQAGTLIQEQWHDEVVVFINSHKEITDFVRLCTGFKVEQCPERQQILPDGENPLNLPMDFLDKLFKDFDGVYACFPDGLGLAPFSFPWYNHVKSYKEFLKIKVNLFANPLSQFSNHPALKKHTKNIFINLNSITPEKNWSMTKIQKLIDLFNTTKYNVILARISSWKGTPLPFFCQGNFYDLVDKPINEVVGVMNYCQYFAGIDSGMAHIAYHLGLPRLVIQQHFNTPFHQVRWHEDCTDDVPMEITPEAVFNRILLNLREPITTAIPAYLNVPANINKKQLLIQKYYA